jgi:hypothetical protein
VGIPDAGVLIATRARTNGKADSIAIAEFYAIGLEIRPAVGQQKCGHTNGSFSPFEAREADSEMYATDRQRPRLRQGWKCRSASISIVIEIVAGH